MLERPPDKAARKAKTQKAYRARYDDGAISPNVRLSRFVREVLIQQAIDAGLTEEAANAEGFDRAKVAAAAAAVLDVWAVRYMEERKNRCR